jgi:predicted nuclease of predicted toxin-antitoxin system
VKLLLDQNISFRTIKKIEAIFPLSSQVRLLGLENAADLEIWNYA